MRMKVHGIRRCRKPAPCRREFADHQRRRARHPVVLAAAGPSAPGRCTTCRREQTSQNRPRNTGGCRWPDRAGSEGRRRAESSRAISTGQGRGSGINAGRLDHGRLSGRRSLLAQPHGSDPSPRGGLHHAVGVDRAEHVRLRAPAWAARTPGSASMACCWALAPCSRRCSPSLRRASNRVATR